MGYEPILAPNLNAHYKTLAGHGPEQIADLYWAFQNPEIDAVFCTRGGYGTPRYLRDLDYTVFRDNPKWLVGYSDITAVQSALLRYSGLVTLSGPMVAIEMGCETGIDPWTEKMFWKMLQQPLVGLKLSNPPNSTWTVHRPGRATGVLVGGCLSLVANLMGTPYAPPLEGTILVLEDIGENVQHVDRMLTQFKLAGAFDHQKGIRGLILGQFLETWDEAGKDDFTLAELVQDIIGEAPFPVVSEVAYGHGERKMSLPLGARITLDTETQTIEILSPVEEQPS